MRRLVRMMALALALAVADAVGHKQNDPAAWPALNLPGGPTRQSLARRDGALAAMASPFRAVTMVPSSAARHARLG